MPVFSYSARSAAGDIQNGEINLPTREEVVGYLRRQRMIPVAVRPKAREIKFALGSGVKTREIVIFTRQFATMINAGLPLVQSLTILSEQTENKRLASVISAVLHDIEAGQTLADSLRKHPKIFTDLFVNMVAAGEAGGILDTILNRLATFLEKNDALARKVKGAMVYPGVMLVVMIGAITVLLWKVVPVFAEMFAGAGMALPMPTRIVLAISAFLQSYILLMVIGVIAGVFLLGRFYATPNGKLMIDKFMLRMPVLGR